jgi:hypothetical protein
LPEFTSIPFILGDNAKELKVVNATSETPRTKNLAISNSSGLHISSLSNLLFFLTLSKFLSICKVTIGVPAVSLTRKRRLGEL